jgi:hypothetical protein
MNYITGQDRHQMRFFSPADEIGSDNPVRFIEAFVDKMDLFQVRLKHLQGQKDNSRQVKTVMWLIFTHAAAADWLQKVAHFETLIRT